MEMYLQSVDGTNFRVPYLSPIFFTLKFNGSDLRYEVVVSIQDGDNHWTYHPFPCGPFNYLQIFWRGLKKEFDPNKKVQVDKMYDREAH